MFKEKVRRNVIALPETEKGKCEMCIFFVCEKFSLIVIHKTIAFNYIWVIILKTSQNCHIEGKNETCEFFYVILWK